MSKARLIFSILAVLGLWARTTAFGADAKVAGPEDPDFKMQGEYLGEIKPPAPMSV